jgi:hypothetical protein
VLRSEMPLLCFAWKWLWMPVGREAFSSSAIGLRLPTATHLLSHTYFIGLAVWEHDSAHLSPILHLVKSGWLLVIGHLGCIHTIEISKHCKSGLFIYLISLLFDREFTCILLSIGICFPSLF